MADTFTNQVESGQNATSVMDASPVPLSATPREFTELVDDINRDIANRQSWASEQREWERLRLCKEKRAKLPYPGAPDIDEPIADDNICALTSQELMLLWNSRVLAIFLPQDAEAMQYKAMCESAFDSTLRLTLNIRSKIENLFDLKNERGMSIAKLCVDGDAMPGYNLPTVEPLDPLEVIVPTGTKRLKDADRICHDLRYTEREFWQEAERRGWKNVAAVVAANKQKAQSTAGGSTSDTTQTRGRRNDAQMPNDSDEIRIWEVYHYRKADDGKYRRFCTVLCPDLPEQPLAQFPWKWQDKVVMEQSVDPITGQAVPVARTIEGEDRRWPFVQFRYENRRLAFYDTRGAAEKLKSDQRIASANLRAKGVIQDYVCKPFIKGGSAVPATFRWRPGDVLPDGMEFIVPEIPTGILNAEIDIARQAASRRVGSPYGSLMSTLSNPQERRTATEVSTTSSYANTVSSDSVERFSEPLSELFSMMWEYLQHNPAPLASIKGDRADELPQEAYSQRFVIVSGVTGRTAMPQFLLSQLQSVGTLFASFPQATQYVKGDGLCKLVFDLIEPKLTSTIVVDPALAGKAGGAPIEQVVAQLVQQVQNLSNYMSEIASEDIGQSAEQPQATGADKGVQA